MDGILAVRDALARCSANEIHQIACSLAAAACPGEPGQMRLAEALSNFASCEHTGADARRKGDSHEEP